MNRKAFTLIELMVAVAIIGMVIGLLIPALLSARESSRRTQCTNNQRQLAEAIFSYDTAKKHLPGYANQVGTTTPRAVSWIAMLLPYLDRSDLWESGWNTGAAGAPVVTLKQLVCPDDTRTATYSLSYVVNVGPTLPDYTVDTQWNLTNQHGVFTDRVPVLVSGAPTPSPPISVSLSDIKSPTQRPLLSESRYLAPSTTLASRSWSATASATGTAFTDTDLAPLSPALFGFVWPSGTAAANITVGSANVLPPIHTGIVIVTFCDGHTESLSADAQCTNYDNSNVQ